ncbi:MAG: HAD family hydrolase [Akkermansiaceae bacterium]|nr:HAD family hydrolase [Akkermansiaceae bacterium]
MLHGLIFDLDGTLVDSLPGIAEALNGALAERGHPGHPEERVRTFIGNGTWMLARRGLPPEVPDEEVAAVEEAVLARYARTWRTGTRVYDDIAPLLADLAGRGVALAIFSNKAHAHTVTIAAELFGDIPFCAVLGHREGSPRKPDPSGALEIAAQMHLAPAQVGFVGDSTIDYETADNAGMQPLLVTWGYHPRAALARTQALLLDDPRHLHRHLAGLHPNA